MTWEEFLNKKVKEERRVQTNIDCPKCGRKIYWDSTFVLTSFPAKYAYWCSCGWYDYAPFKYEVMKDDKERGNFRVNKV